MIDSLPAKAKDTCTFDGEPHTLTVKGRHDPCVLPRAPPLIEGMAALTLADACMRQRARSGLLQTLPEAYGAEASAASARRVSADAMGKRKGQLTNQNCGPPHGPQLSLGSPKLLPPRILSSPFRSMLQPVSLNLPQEMEGNCVGKFSSGLFALATFIVALFSLKRKFCYFQRPLWRWQEALMHK